MTDESASPVEYARARRVLRAPLNAVWDVISRFGGVEAWIVGVSACSLDGEGVGAVRTLQLQGRSAREQLIKLDPAAHTLTYAILEPHALPAKDVRSTITLRAIAADQTEAVWVSKARAFGVPPEALGARINEFYARSLAQLEQLLDAR